jgi:flagellar basal-body rod protein FlgF
LIKGIYTAGSGMMLQMARQDVVANNLANVNTTGFKKSSTVARAFPAMLMSRLGELDTSTGSPQPQKAEVIGYLGTGACLDGIINDYSVGNLKQTHNATDLAFGRADTYLAVETPDGVCYTRAGNLKINGDGLLTTNQGYAVLDDNYDYIYLEGEFAVDEMGYVTDNGEEIARLLVVGFENQDELERLGGSLLRTDQEPELVDMPEILPGYLEESNVVAVQEMVTLINVVRSYEALQKIIQSEDEATQTVLNEVGRI